MIEMLTATSRPHFAAGVRLHHDAARDCWVLLAPERVLLLDEIAHAVLQRCDGAATLDAIVDALAQEYQAQREQIATDVRALLVALIAKRMLHT
jgi:pyrroloquinoline quinone biosynthesis protein D